MAFRNRSTEHPQHQTEFKIPRVQKHKTEFENNFPFLDRRTPAHSMSVTEAQRHLKKIRTVANWLDNAVPYSPIPIGLDTFVGFIPILGDFAGLIFSCYQIYLSCLLGIPLWLLLRMVANVIIDTFVGMVPLGGRVIDTFYKANIWNYESLEDWIVAEGIFEVSDRTRRDADRRAQQEEKAYGLNFRTAWKLANAFFPYGRSR
ncbi:hypothetical protein INT43_001401 [Umbelopsis isabellina]|uniref:Uncharacterized protein n=1 Tax=Mortierella isabellina TaxID=91625 RepID=A0A8H7PDZ1_MORIS|nr:hypothetical protein INT43_001401 [Umbelopsis isabellina]